MKSVRRASRFVMPLTFALGWVSCVWANVAGDPTEAPAVWIAAQPVAPGSVPRAMGEASPELQVILTGRSRKLVVVNGEVVKVGDLYKGSKVVAIRGDKLVLEDASKSVDMTPGVSKAKPAPLRVQKKRVVLPGGDVSPKGIGSQQ